jgi:hypothetical protein
MRSTGRQLPARMHGASHRWSCGWQLCPVGHKGSIFLSLWGWFCWLLFVTGFSNTLQSMYHMYHVEEPRWNFWDPSWTSCAEHIVLGFLNRSHYMPSRQGLDGSVGKACQAWGFVHQRWGSFSAQWGMHTRSAMPQRVYGQSMPAMGFCALSRNFWVQKGTMPLVL